MTPVFVDTNYWVAALNPRDQWHAAAGDARRKIGARPLVTTESVLIELLNYFAPLRPRAKSGAAGAVRDIFADAAIETVRHGRADLLDALTLYESRLDKGYSLTDCLSMNVMRERGINDVLTHDHHFEQEGFNILL